ncbi:MAG: zinc ribbon domain-containing protein [Sedimentisphaerales bacterium]|jgi:hypothetical protein
MNIRTGKFLNVIAAGFIVLVLFSLVLFTGRYYCFEALMEPMPLEWKKVTICPSGLLPGEGSPRQTKDILTYADAGISSDPNTRLSAVQFELNDYFIRMGAIGVSRGYMPGMPNRQFRTKDGVYYIYWDKDDYLLFSERSGQIISSYSYTAKDGKHTKVYFAGPNGVSEKASVSLGRFEEPIVERTYFQRLGLYEVKQRRFYLIDYRNSKVTAGPELPRGDNIEPMGVGEGDYSGGSWVSPEIKDVNGVWQLQTAFLPACAEPNERWIRFGYGYTTKYLNVLDKSGRIYELDTDNWSFRDVGFLPTPRSLYSGSQDNAAAKPGNLLNYQINPVYYGLIEKSKRHPWETKDVSCYFGMCACSLSREGTALAVAVFDPNGKLVYRGDTQTKGGISTASAVYSESPMATTILFLLENLQPPAFEIASYLCGDSIEPSAGHRALFILPNSFVGMLGRYDGTKFDKEVFLPLLMGPSLILSIWLAFRIRKDAKIIGLSSRAGTWWTAGTIAFGLPAYITYRLTRPKETLVTCQNCGSMRRPDMEICHRCGSKWEMPELTPPNWRICD